MSLIDSFQSKGWGSSMGKFCLFNISNLYNQNTTIQASSFDRNGFKDCNLIRVQLQNCDITGCQLDSCDLVNCRIDSSSVKDSKMQNCTVMHQSNITTTTADKCLIFDSSFEGSTLKDSICFDSTIANSALAKCRAETVELISIQVNNSRLRFCVISQDGSGSSSILSNTSISNCKTTSRSTQLRNCRITRHPLAFRKFPSEIRHMIFEYAIDGNGWSPPIIQALRGEPKLYQEAIDVLNRTCVFKMGKHEFEKWWSIDPVHWPFPPNPNYQATSNAARKRVKHVSIPIIHADDRKGERILASFGNLRTIHIDLSVGYIPYDAKIFNFLEEQVICRASSVTRVSITFQILSDNPHYSESYKILRYDCIGELVERLNRWFGVQGVLENVDDDGKRTTFFWKEKSGNALTLDYGRKATHGLSILRQL